MCASPQSRSSRLGRGLIGPQICGRDIFVDDASFQMSHEGLTDLADPTRDEQLAVTFPADPAVGGAERDLSRISKVNGMSMDRARDVGLIEAAFRIANERTARWEERHSEGRSELYLCECGEQPCRKRVELTREQYEAVRADARHFVVLPGHVIPELETVVGSFSGYEVIEKPNALIELLVETDPRSPTSGPEEDAALALAEEIDPDATA